VERVAERIGRALERRGILSRNAESSYLELDPEASGPMEDLWAPILAAARRSGERNATRRRVAGGSFRARDLVPRAALFVSRRANAGMQHPYKPVRADPRYVQLRIVAKGLRWVG